MNRGFVAITSILIIAAVVLSISVSIAILGISESRNSLDYRRGILAFSYAQACGEEALLRSRNDSDYTSGSLSFGEGSCTITVSSVSGGKQIDVNAQVDGPPVYVKKIRIVSEQDGNGVTVVTWQEVG